MYVQPDDLTTTRSADSEPPRLDGAARVYVDTDRADTVHADIGGARTLCQGGVRDGD